MNRSNDAPPPPPADVRDVWLSSDVTLFESRLTWRSQCPSADLKIFASLCWRLHKHLCAPIPNSTLEAEDDGAQRVRVSAAGCRLTVTVTCPYPVPRTGVQHVCRGQTPSDVCAGETRRNTWSPPALSCTLTSVFCRQFSLQGSYNISCHFHAGESVSQHVGGCFVSV